MHLDGASSSSSEIFFFPRVDCLGPVWDNLIDATPEVSLQGLRSIGLFLVSHRVLPLGETQTYPALGCRPFVGLQLRARVLGAPDDHLRASLGSWWWYCGACVGVMDGNGG
jgi:hypothetical protein